MSQTEGKWVKAAGRKSQVIRTIDFHSNQLNNAQTSPTCNDRANRLDGMGEDIHHAVSRLS